MGKRLGFLLAGAGIAVAVFGLRQESGSNLQMVGVMGGFILFAAGLGTLADVRGVRSRERPEESDTPTRVRLVGVIVVLGSVLLPYSYLPLGAGGGRSGYSFLDLVGALYSGTQLDGGFMLLVFMTLVVFGGFISILHHIGGYLMLFGAVGYGYYIMDTLGAEIAQVVMNEFGLGMYMGLIGALVIVGSSFLSYDTADIDRGIYGSGER